MLFEPSTDVLFFQKAFCASLLASVIGSRVKVLQQGQVSAAGSRFCSRVKFLQQGQGSAVGSLSSPGITSCILILNQSLKHAILFGIITGCYQQPRLHR